MDLTDASDSFVEVVGEGRFEEEIETFIAEVAISAPSTKKSSASDRGESMVKKCIAALRASGIEQNEIKEGGMRFNRDWWTKRNQLARKLIVECSDLSRLTASLEKVEAISKQRKLITVSMREPIFSASQATKDQALSVAINAATQKAKLIAEKCEAKLGRVLRVEEAETTTRASGFMGDENWRSPFGGMRRRAAVPNSEPLDTPNRVVTVALRVRFEIVVE